MRLPVVARPVAEYARPPRQRELKTDRDVRVMLLSKGKALQRQENKTHKKALVSQPVSHSELVWLG